MNTRILKALLESLPKLRGISIRQPFAELVLRDNRLCDCNWRIRVWVRHRVTE